VPFDVTATKLLRQGQKAKIKTESGMAAIQQKPLVCYKLRLLVLNKETTCLLTYFIQRKIATVSPQFCRMKLRRLFQEKL